MHATLKAAVAIAVLAAAAAASAQITFYEHPNYTGRSFTTEQAVTNFSQYGFNDRASSVVVMDDRWEVCIDAGYGGRCVVLRAGRYPSLIAMGLDDRVSSTRNLRRNAQINDDRYAPQPAPYYDNRRRNNERLYEADVISVRAVVGPPEQRCWIEKEQVNSGRGDANVPGAVVGALLGGILGHQIGGGTGRDIATAGGAVAGGVLGSNVGRDRNGNATYTRDVQRCADVPSQSRTEYWDVTYNFRGREHRVQMTSPPGATVVVNRQGEPRS